VDDHQIVNAGFTNMIAAGGFHTCAIVASDSTVACWGMNNDGQLGRPPPDPRLSDPWEPTPGPRVQIESGCNYCGDKITFLLGATTIAASIGVGQVGSGGVFGGFHTVALDSSGLDWGWGHNNDGELTGTSSGAHWGAVRGVIAPPGTPLVPSKITAGAYHTCMSSATGVFCRGHNGNGEAGSPSSTTAVPMTAGALDVAAGGYHTCAIVGPPSQSNLVGAVVCWGENGDGQVTGIPGPDVATPFVIIP
jgi:alpha-tubulin suppressor-like RCC1 family protein